MSQSVGKLRWFTKKAARKSVAAATMMSGRLDSLEHRSSQPNVRVLTYHRFGDGRRDPFCVSAADFRAQIEYLAQHELALSYPELCAHLDGELPLGRHRVVVTIDDGFDSTHSIALPILREFSVPAISFVSSGLIESGVSRFASRGETYMNWSQVRELQQQGITIGSHAVTHRSLTQLPPKEMRDEIETSRLTLENMLETDVACFAYPFGTRADYSAETRSALAAAGYQHAFTSQHGSVKLQSDHLTLPRIKVEGGEGIKWFSLLARGGMDGWRFVDQRLSRLQDRRHGQQRPR